ncbi:protein RRP5 [Biomphalaria glabrata]|nr:putative protein RRP5 [Biomphalaria glabrata]
MNNKINIDVNKMWKAEEDFPRGKTPIKKNVQGLIESKSKEPKFEKSPKESVGEIKKPQKRKSLHISSQPTKKRRISGNQKVFKTPLQDDICTGLRVLGCVRHVFDHSISVSLPGNVVGTLPITELSECYTQHLKTLVDSEENHESEDIKSLDELFKPGMLIPVHIERIDEKQDQKAKKIILSNNPCKLNSTISVKSLADGMLLFGSVSSVEDHGYSVDLGIKGLKVFLPSNNAEAFIKTCNCGSPLSVGQPLWCVTQLKDKVKFLEGENRVLTVTIDPLAVQSSALTDTSNLNCFLPGMNFKGIIQSVFDGGLVVNVLTFPGHVHITHLWKHPNLFSVGQQVSLKLLYIDVNTKTLHLTALPKHVQFDGRPIKFFGDLQIGTICEAKVAWTQNKKGVMFHLPNKITGFAAMSQLSDVNKEFPDLQKYTPNSTHKCRILGFNFMDGLALITLKKRILQMKFVRINEISVGELLEVIVKDVTANGILVKLAKSIFSFITCLHLADVPIKKPEKKFTPGMKLKCRVLGVDVEKNKVFLTHKRSLVKLKNPVTEYSQLRPQMELEGYISAIKERVVIVTFFNNVKGYVTLKDMSKEKVESPDSLFYVGQVIRCRVVFFNAVEKKLKLSFNLGDESVTSPRKCLEPLDISIRKISEAVILSVDSIGYTLGIQNKRKAFLPFYHLSDFHEVQELRKMAFKPGHKLQGLTFFKQKEKIILTMKESFVSAADTNNWIETFEDLKSGMLLPAVIKNHQDYGMFLEIVNGFTGLCPTKTLSYLQPSNLQELFKPGQSVMTRLAKIDTEKQRFLGSVHIKECCESGVDSSLSTLRSYLLSRTKAHLQLFNEHDELAVYKDLKVGDLVEVVVNSVLKKGILCDTTAGAKGLVTKDHFGDLQPKVGKCYQGVILFIDLLTPCIEVTLDSKVVQAVKSFKETDKTKLKTNQILKANILLMKPEFMLMGLKGHGSGKFVYVPVKQHLNDVNLKSFKIGSYTEVVIKDCIEGLQLAVFKMYDLEVNSLTPDKYQPADITNQNTLMGIVMEAKIRSIHALQINVMVNKFHGRIHITEICDSVENGENPLKRFHPEQIVKVKVIGFRDLITHQYLPITRPVDKHVLLECTAKESKMQLQLASCQSPQTELKEGDALCVYVNKVSHDKVWVQVNLSQQGYIDYFHLSRDTDVLNTATSHFLPGQGYHATVLKIDSDNRIVLSLIGSEIQLIENEGVIALITCIKQGKRLLVKLPCGRLGVVNQKPSVLHYVGQYIRCRLESLTKDSDRCELSLLDDSAMPPRKVRKRKELTQTPTTEVKKPKKKVSKKKSENIHTIEKDENVSDNECSKALPVSVPRLAIEGFSWKGEVMPHQSHPSHNQESDDETETTKSESLEIKKKRKHAEELKIQEHELDQLKDITHVQSSSDFEKLVLQSPNSSVVWIAYMTYHIELGEIEKARLVAERAINTILFREEQEKMNVWMAYLNMETTYGDPADVKKLLDRAASCNNPLDMYLKMCDIYVANEKTSEAEELFKVMTHKYKHEKLLWKSYGHFLFKSGKVDIARSVLQRAIHVLDKRDHVEVIIKFATLEFSHGDIERGCTIFENLIASYPGRTDLWSVYVDMMVKSGDIAGARHLLERAVKQKFNAKKLSFLLQKFKRFEETHGTEEQVEKVKELASSVLN